LAFIGGSSLAERGSQMDKTDANCFLSWALKFIIRNHYPIWCYKKCTDENVSLYKDKQD
jgi:hypothetical protein